MLSFKPALVKNMPENQFEGLTHYVSAAVSAEQPLGKLRPAHLCHELCHSSTVPLSRLFYKW